MITRVILMIVMLGGHSAPSIDHIEFDNFSSCQKFRETMLLIPIYKHGAVLNCIKADR